LKAIVASLRRELLLQWRDRGQFVAIFAFAAVALFLFSFAIGPDAGALRRHAAGYFWLAMMLASTLTLAESFQSDTEHRALEGLLLLPVSPRAIFYGKAIGVMSSLMLLGLVLLPLSIILYDAATVRIAELLGIILLGSAGIAAPGTTYAAMTSGVRGRGMLLPLLLFPLLVPVLLASVRATSLLILGDPMGQLRSWTLLLVSFDLIYWALCGLLFEKVVED
jgi:heme exporter protein B